MTPATGPYALMARNNAWANARLLGACAELQPGEFTAARTGFFPSLALTLNHNHGADAYYLRFLESAVVGATAPADPVPFHDDPARLAAAQAALDARLIALCEGLAPADLSRIVAIRRDGHGLCPERMDMTLLHLFQHQVHHRGQAHAMLSAIRVAPPQLDEFFLDFERHPTAQGYLP